MIKYMYVKRDKKAKFYQPPYLTDLDPQAYTQVVCRGCAHLADKEQILILRDCELIYLGVFDDEKGTFCLKEREKLLDFSDYLSEVN